MCALALFTIILYLSAITQSQQIISEHVIANQRQYQAYCRRLYAGNDEANDLFQDFYLKVITMEPQKVTKAYCYRTIYVMFCLAHRRKPNLTELHDMPGGDGFNEVTIQAQAVEAHVKRKLDSPHNFLEMAVFDQAQSESLRSINRKTKIPLVSLHRYYHSARVELMKVAQNNLYI